MQRSLGLEWKQRSQAPPGYLKRHEAEAELAKLLEDAARGTLPEQRVNPRTFREAADRWLHVIEHEKNSAASTVRGYRRYVERMLIPEFDGELHDVTSERIDAWRRRLLADEKLKRTTIRQALVLLNGILKRARREGWISEDTMARVDPVSVGSSGRFNFLSPKRSRPARALA